MTAENQTEPVARGVWWAGALVVAAVGAYLLVFVRHGLLGIGQLIVGEQTWRLPQVLLALVVGGALGSALAGRRFRVIRWQRQLARGCRFAGAVGAAALLVTNWPALLVVALLAGLVVGSLGVTLASGLRPAIGTARLGRLIGTGVGLAWLIAGVVETWLPATTPAIVAAALLVAAASVAGPFLTPQEPSVSSRPDFRPVVFWWWTVALMGFVVLTVSAREVAFAPAGADAVRSTSAIYEVGLGLAAAAAALAVGWAFDREAWGRAVGVGVVIAIGAAAAHARGLTLPGVNLAAAGCALAVVTLVYLAARSGRSRQAAALFGFAGWGGAWLGTLVGRLDGGAAIAAVSVAIAITVAALVIRARFVRLFGRG